MTYLNESKNGFLKAIAWALALASLASIVVHYTYIYSFGSDTGSWPRSLRSRYGVAFGPHYAGLFGPSIILMFMWWVRKENHWLIGVSVVLAFLAYHSWQPLPLSLLSAWDRYPTHLEAFHNFTLRGDWLAYE